MTYDDGFANDYEQLEARIDDLYAKANKTNQLMGAHIKEIQDRIDENAEQINATLMELCEILLTDEVQKNIDYKNKIRAMITPDELDKMGFG